MTSTPAARDQQKETSATNQLEKEAAARDQQKETTAANQLAKEAAARQREKKAAAREGQAALKEKDRKKKQKRKKKMRVKENSKGDICWKSGHIQVDSKSEAA